ncbi:DNA-directed RNA polymerase I subunit 1 [Olea europaea subsp. europaea]|uniref:DNA-directed RNA polymerase subunit n=1 Tax=Olea europaea subsp. europaea TaxID=158383 RepID=A0A8S0UWA0_OLEEU|nr:DNA-directed RNA polymerase I subunit 1 [Olea europaea subsp. europaea]
MAQSTEGATEAVEAVKFGFMTDEEVRSQSVVKVVNPNLLDTLEKPIPGGLYDPAMGPLDENFACKTCGQRSYHCPGHCGHIDLVSPVYNPLLFNMLHNLLNKTCFHCLHFRSSRGEVENCVTQLEQISEGDIIGAKRLNILQKVKEKKKKKDWVLSNDLVDPEDSEGSHISDAELQSDRRKHSKHNKRGCWDSCQFTEAMYVLNEFLKKKEKKCKNCDGNNPKINKPTFGWFHMRGPSANQTRSNAIRHGRLGVSKNGGVGDKSSSEVVNASDCSWKDDSDTAEANSSVAPSDTLGNVHVNSAEHSKIINRWMDLQQSINVLYDSKTATGPGKKDITSGICQLLEKKEGIFRQKMMGKRVNFACRSVISPDPYLAVNEIGVPPYFALRLTYPERVTPWNSAKLRNAIINGPDIHPGATTYVDKISTVKLPLNKKMRIAISRKLPSSRGVVTQSGTKNEYECEGKIVYRHLQDGDIVLVNRQPTLHKPSIMAHVVRVLKGEKTLRMHYANCSSYNADFDGDEINVHFPQDEISRAEAYNIVNANEQYIVPTRGDTVRGLIQDHIVSAVLLTMKDTFLCREEFNQLLYGSGVFAMMPSSHPVNNSQKVSLVDSAGVVMQSILPAVWKPGPLWTGKQVITALLNHVTRGCAPCTIKNQGKLPKDYFTDSTYKNEEEEDRDQNAEHKLLIWKNELVRGVIDKAQFGKFGLVHTVQELFGSKSAGIFLSALSCLFTIFLQIHGFTCGVDDLIILPNYDMERKEKLEGDDVGEEVHCDFVKFKRGQIGPEELQLEIEKVICSNRESATASLDMKMKNKLTNKGSQISKKLLTKGLLKPFPKNCISVMTTTGAKGSTVNFQQISSYLGQQELEGKRVPRMVSGKTLPCFSPWNFTSRAGGYITDRFLTGLRPQEYYFHCMAGREGLVDTAVKTSRSGYLQRCLIKNLESLKVSYDYTVRDADGSIIQFYYGEDGVDVHCTSFLKNFEALADNQETICRKFQNKREFNSYIEKLPDCLEKEARHFICDARKETAEVQKLTEMEHLPKGRKSKKKENLLEERRSTEKAQNEFLELVEQKYLSSLAQSGEPVGVIAAQSIGEPSTQMTLNTFHLAGRGEMNVTLGIPRLQEILMTASDTIKTPILTCPFIRYRSKPDVMSLIAHVKKVCIADLAESMEVELSINDQQVARIYKLKMKLKATEFVSLKDLHATLRSTFLRELEEAIENHVVFLSRISGIRNFTVSSPSETLNEADNNSTVGSLEEDMDDDMDADGVERGEDLGSDAQKRKQQSTDEMDYDDGSDSSEDEPDEGELSSELEEQTDQDHLEEVESRKDEETDLDDDEASNMQNDNEMKSESKSSRGGVKSTAKNKRSGEESSDKKPRRAIYIAVRGLHFEVHFKFTMEPHLLLAQIAQKTAKKVYIKSPGKISHCKMVKYDADEKSVIWDDDNKPRKSTVKDLQTSNEDLDYWAMKASGVDFKSFWEMQDDLDMSRLYSNNIDAMLKTYGVEAARATIIREVKQVFDIYGVKIDYRHLSLIADYMTHTGGYRPMTRHGSIAESLSPFLKMSFETASKFIVEAASHGMTDNLETPSSRICVGLPVKMGTGCFDIMQELEV